MARASSAYGANTVKTHFTESSVLFGVDQLIKGVINALARILRGIESILPVPGLDTMVNLINAIMRMSLTYVDEIILAYLLRTRSLNPWEAAQDGLVLYAQNYRHLLKNAAWLTMLIWADDLYPVPGLPADRRRRCWRCSRGRASVWVLVFAFLFAWALKKGDHGAHRHRRPDAGLFRHHRRPDAGCGMARAGWSECSDPLPRAGPEGGRLGARPGRANLPASPTDCLAPGPGGG